MTLVRCLAGTFLIKCDLDIEAIYNQWYSKKGYDKLEYYERVVGRKEHQAKFITYLCSLGYELVPFSEVQL